MTRLRWTTKSTRTLAEELTRQGHPISHHTVGRLLTGPLGYSLQANAKTVEGKQSPDRDAQFRYANAGRTWCPTGQPRQVDVQDFPGELGKAIPYGVGADTGWVSVGDDGDTATFAVETVRRWWTTTDYTINPANTPE